MHTQPKHILLVLISVFSLYATDLVLQSDDVQIPIGMIDSTLLNCSNLDIRRKYKEVKTAESERKFPDAIGILSYGATL